MKYKNLALLITFSKQQKQLKTDLPKIVIQFTYNRSIVVYKPLIKDISLYKPPVKYIIINSSKV